MENGIYKLVIVVTSSRLCFGHIDRQVLNNSFRWRFPSELNRNRNYVPYSQSRNHWRGIVMVMASFPTLKILGTIPWRMQHFSLLQLLCFFISQEYSITFQGESDCETWNLANAREGWSFNQWPNLYLSVSMFTSLHDLFFLKWSKNEELACSMLM